MRLSLLGPEFRFYGLFTARSDHLVAAAGFLRDAVLRFPSVSGPAEKIHELGDRTEETAREIIRELSMTTSRSADREDVHALNSAFTLSSTAIRGLVSRLGLYGLRKVGPSVPEMAEDLVGMAGHIRKMLEVVNRGERAAELSAAVAADREDFDRFLLVGLGELYETEPSSGPEVMQIVKWSQIYDRFEETMNAVHRITTILESIILKGL